MHKLHNGFIRTNCPQNCNTFSEIEHTVHADLLHEHYGWHTGMHTRAHTPTHAHERTHAHMATRNFATHLQMDFPVNFDAPWIYSIIMIVLFRRVMAVYVEFIDKCH